MSKVQDKMGYMLNSKCLKGCEMKHNNLVFRILNQKKCHFCSNFVSLTKQIINYMQTGHEQTGGKVGG